MICKARHHYRIIPQLVHFRSSALNGSFQQNDFKTRFNIKYRGSNDFIDLPNENLFSDLTKSNFSIIKTAITYDSIFLRHINLIHRFISRCVLRPFNLLIDDQKFSSRFGARSTKTSPIINAAQC